MQIDATHILVIISGANLASLIVFGIKVVTFINKIEFKTDLMWIDYNNRVNKIEGTVRVSSTKNRRKPDGD